MFTELVVPMSPLAIELLSWYSTVDPLPFVASVGRFGASLHHADAQAQVSVRGDLDDGVGDRDGTGPSPMPRHRTLWEVQRGTETAEFVCHHRIPTGHHV